MHPATPNSSVVDVPYQSASTGLVELDKDQAEIIPQNTNAGSNKIRKTAGKVLFPFFTRKLQLDSSSEME